MARKLGKRIRASVRRLVKRHLPSLHIRREGLVPYTKPYLTPADLITKLQASGLTVHSVPHAQNVLSIVNYYRFKVYLRPFLTPPDFKQFQGGATFVGACELQDFDRDLRSLVMALTGIIEVTLRHSLDAHVGAFLKDPFWYLNERIYAQTPTETIKKIVRSVNLSNEEFSQHFRRKYHSPARGKHYLLPPFWMASETFTLGQLLYLMKGLDKVPFAGPTRGSLNELDKMARKWGAFNITDLERWVEYLRNLRNWCAHHNRLWSRNMGVPSNVQRHLSPAIAGKSPNNHRIYLHLVMMRIMLQNQQIPDNIAAALQALFVTYPTAAAMKNQMGFPSNWLADPFWH
ncbi:Abi family protein [Dyella sp. S184]|uniref:Abi family protein n=1 Tax=Dyella sp. S184 TaxID=1641862 RepID=UPI00131E0BA7|nr:Abi family protein [Dyella sp. S184]